MGLAASPRAHRTFREVLEVYVEMFREPEQRGYRKVSLAVLVVGERGLSDPSEVGERRLRHLAPDPPCPNPTSQRALGRQRIAGHALTITGCASPTSDARLVLKVTAISRGHWPVSRNAR